MSCPFFSFEQVEVNRSLGSGEGELSLLGLRDQGYKAVFVGIGNPDAKRIPLFEGLTEDQGFYTSKSFLPKVAAASKPGGLDISV